MGRLSFLGLGPWAKTELSASVVKIKLSRSEILLAQNTRAKPSDKRASKPLTRFDFFFVPRRRDFPRLSAPSASLKRPDAPRAPNPAGRSGLWLGV